MSTPDSSVLTADPAGDGRTDDFLALSELLTGYGRVDLAGTGQVEQYLRLLADVLPPGVLDELLCAGRQGAAAGPVILGDPKLGPVARNIILLWYRGTWPADTNHVVSAAAYQAGLQWLAAKAHPAGALQQGFGAWAEPPDGAGQVSETP